MVDLYLTFDDEIIDSAIEDVSGDLQFLLAASWKLWYLPI